MKRKKVFLREEIENAWCERVKREYQNNRNNG